MATSNQTRMLEYEGKFRTPVMPPADWGSLLANNEIIINTSATLRPMVITKGHQSFGSQSGSRAVQIVDLAHFFYENVLAKQPDVLATAYFKTIEAELLDYRSVPFRQVRTVSARINNVGKLKPLPLPED